MSLRRDQHRDSYEEGASSSLKSCYRGVASTVFCSVVAPVAVNVLERGASRLLDDTRPEGDEPSEDLRKVHDWILDLAQRTSERERELEQEQLEIEREAEQARLEYERQIEATKALLANTEHDPHAHDDFF